MFKTRLIAFMSTLAALTIAHSAFGWTSNGRWNSDTFTMRASKVSFPQGSPFRDALGTVRDRFNENPGNIRIIHSWDDTSIAMGNGQNEVWASDSLTDKPAVCYTWYNISGWIKETDVVFATGINYSTTTNKTSLRPYGGSFRPFQTTALHEYGHAGGLSHESDEYNIMGEDWTHVTCNGTTVRAYLGEDACDGYYDLYGPASWNIEDVGVTVFRRSGEVDGYSTHDFCSMGNTSGRMLGQLGTYEGQPRWRVAPGQTVSVTFSYENNGKTHKQSPNIAFYISSNNIISTNDRQIRTGKMDLTRDNVRTISSNVTIPADLTPGQTYFLGVIVDWDNAISEVTGSNNAAYHPIYINF